MMNHLFHCDGQRVLIAKYHHAQGVADQDGIDAGAILCKGGRIIVRRQHRNGFAPRFLLKEERGGGFLSLGRDRVNGCRVYGRSSC